MCNEWGVSWNLVSDVLSALLGIGVECQGIVHSLLFDKASVLHMINVERLQAFEKQKLR